MKVHPSSKLGEENPSPSQRRVRLLYDKAVEVQTSRNGHTLKSKRGPVLSFLRRDSLWVKVNGGYALPQVMVFPN